MTGSSFVRDASESPADGGFSEGSGKRIRALREKAGYSQRNLVDAVNGAHALGWHQTTLAKTEAGERPIRFYEAICIAGVLGVDVSALDPASDVSQSNAEIQIVASRLDEVQRVMEQLGARRDQYLKKMSALRLSSDIDVSETFAVHVPSSAEVQHSVALAKKADESPTGSVAMPADDQTAGEDSQPS